MKPTTKILVSAVGLMLPYIGFAVYLSWTHPQNPHPFPNWFLYVAPCYFFGSIALLVALRKRIVGNIPPQDVEKQARSAADIESDRRRLKMLWMGVGLYSLIFLNSLRMGLANLGQLPLIAIILGECLNAGILATFILTLRKVYKKVQEGDRLPADR
jgi:hypothetical protein